VQCVGSVEWELERKEQVSQRPLLLFAVRVASDYSSKKERCTLGPNKSLRTSNRGAILMILSFSLQDLDLTMIRLFCIFYP
jgi:hypothetical protein